MADIVLGSVFGKNATIVSNRFIDEYMADANGEYVKIYLYLLRCMNSPQESISISKIADKFDHTEKDIKRALRYWEKAKLLHLEFDESEHLTGIYFIDSTGMKDALAEEKRETSFATRKRAESPSVSKETPGQHYDADISGDNFKQCYTADTTKENIGGCYGAGAAKESLGQRYSADDLKKFQDEEAVQELLFVTEHYFGRSLTRTEMDTILYWYDALQFHPDLIEYLIEYCTQNNHKSVRYMNKVALSWKENGIVSVKQAKQQVRSHSKTYCAVRKAFGISGRSFAESEASLLDKWIREYHFSDEMICDACNRTMQSIHQPSFEYADTILTSWYENQAFDQKAVAALDNAFQKSRSISKQKTRTVQNKFNNFTARTYNYDQLEQQLLKSSAK